MEEMLSEGLTLIRVDRLSAAIEFMDPELTAVRAGSPRIASRRMETERLFVMVKPRATEVACDQTGRITFTRGVPLAGTTIGTVAAITGGMVIGPFSLTAVGVSSTLASIP